MNTMRRFGSRCCPAPGERPLSAAQADRAARNLELLAHPIRLTLLGILCRRGGEVCVCDLEAAVPVKQPTVSHHLKVLREAGAVTSERRGTWVFYRLAPDLAERVATIARGFVPGGLIPVSELTARRRARASTPTRVTSPSVCFTPSSYSSKSEGCRSVTGRPRESRTTTSMTTAVVEIA